MNDTITARKAVEIAVEAEKIGAKFYERVTLKFQDNPELAAVFKKMAEDEIEHEARFSALLDMTRKDDPAVQNEYGRDEKLRAIAVSEFYKGKIFEKLDDVETVSDALLLGAKFEEAAMKYYKSLQDLLGPGTVVDTLLQEEERHLEIMTAHIKSRLG